MKKQDKIKYFHYFCRLNQKKNMIKRIMTAIRTEDWIATIIGLVVMLLAVLLGPLMPVMPRSLGGDGLWDLVILVAGLYVGLYVCCRALGRRVGWLLPSLVVIVGLALGAQWLSGLAWVKSYTGLEGVFFAVALGLVISNVFGTPKWLLSGAQSEFFVKIGLVLLGTTIIFTEIMRAGALGMVQALVVILSVWGFGYWIARRMGVDREMSTMLASAVSICGVSAAIATCGAIKGDNRKLSYVISLVLVVAIPMMYVMPYAAIWMGLSPEVGGAWLGGTIDTTGAVVAAGSALGETAERYAVIVKSSQNVLLGFAALFISIYWTYKGKTRRDKVTVGVLWERFPKFVLGFLAASLIFSFVLDLDTAHSVGKVTKNLQNSLFYIAFVCIGLETRFKDIFNKDFKKPMYAFLVAQVFNILITLAVAYLLFNYFLLDGEVSFLRKW